MPTLLLTITHDNMLISRVLNNIVRNANSQNGDELSTQCGQHRFSAVLNFAGASAGGAKIL